MSISVFKRERVMVPSLHKKSASFHFQLAPSVPSSETSGGGQCGTGVSGNSHSRSFPRMKASDSLSELWKWIFSFPSRSRILGMDFFIPFPFPNFGNGFFSFPSRSRILGMDFFIPFPIPNFENGFFQFSSRSRIDPFKVGNQKGIWEILRDACIPTFSASCTFHTR